jgi:hypothetical protein
MGLWYQGDNPVEYAEFFEQQIPAAKKDQAQGRRQVMQQFGVG